MLDGDDDPPPHLPLDLAANAASLGARRDPRRARSTELREALERAKGERRSTVIVVEVDRYEGVPGYESWWDVPVAEVSELAAGAGSARASTRRRGGAERRFL